jgi:hypothetical protein
MPINIYTGAGNVARRTDTTVSANTTIAADKPANAVVGDLLELKVTSNNTLNPSSCSVTGDWQLIASNFNVNGANACHTALYWKIWKQEDVDALITGWTVTLGGSTLDDETVVTRADGHDPINPIDAIAASFNSTQSASPICPSVPTTVNGAVVKYVVSAKNGSVLTGEDAGQPTGTTLIQNKRSRNSSGGVNSGIAYELRPTAGATGTRTWQTYTSTSQYHSAFSYAIRPNVSAAITDVNGSDPIVYGQPFTWSTTGFSPAPNQATVAGVACSSVSGSGGIAPALTDGALVPLPGSRQVTGGNGTQSANINKTVAVAEGMFARLLVGTPDTGAGSVVVGFSPAAKASDYLVFPTANNTSISDKAILKTDNVGTLTCVHISVDEANPSRGTAYLYRVLTGPANDRAISSPFVQPLSTNINRRIA